MNPLISTGNYADTAKKICVDHGIFSEDSQLLSEYIDGGNINYTFRVTDHADKKSVIVKIAEEKAKISEDLILDIGRGKNEIDILRIYGSLIDGIAPAVYGYDETHHAIIMEDMRGMTLLSDRLFSFGKVENLAGRLSGFVSQSLFYSSCFRLDGKERREMQLKYVNSELCDLTEKLVFTEPYYPADNNHYSEGNEKYIETRVYGNGELKKNVAALKMQFMTSAQCLIHGDLHFGSFFSGGSRIAVFDPEFAFFGPAGYDLGNVIAHFIIHFYHSLYRCRDKEYSEWLKSCIFDFLKGFRSGFLELCLSQTNDAAYNSREFAERFTDEIITDALGFAGTECIRRVVGLAKVRALTDAECADIRQRLERCLVESSVILICGRKEKNTEALIEEALNIHF